MLGDGDGVLGYGDGVLGYGDGVLGYGDGVLGYGDGVLGYGDGVLGRHCGHWHYSLGREKQSPDLQNPTDIGLSPGRVYFVA